jgi:hypothetical protein
LKTRPHRHTCGRENIEIVRRALERLVAFSFHFDATGRDGVRAGSDQASLVTLRNGLLVRIENYASWDEALEALESSRRGAGAKPTP